MDRETPFIDRGRGFFFLCLFLVLLFGYLVLEPFFTIFLVALALATISYPAYARLLRLTRQRKNLAALLSCLLVICLIILPCFALVGLLAKQSIQWYEGIDGHVKQGVASEEMLERVRGLQERFFPDLDLEKVELGKTLAGLAGRVSQTLMDWSTGAVKAITTALWQFFLMLFALFYFYKEGPAFLRWLMHLIPLPGTLKRQIFQSFREVSESAFYGTFLTAVAQGTLGGIGFLIVGFSPLLWGVAMAFFSLIPLVGTLIIWGPAAVVLFVSGRIGAGIFLTLWGVVVVGMSDNILRPLLMSGKSELHPFLIFFSLLGGIMAFGPLGILLGPLAIVLVISMLRAWGESARPLLEYMDQR